MRILNKGNKNNLDKPTQTITYNKPLEETLHSNIQFLQKVTGNSSDVIIREIEIGENSIFKMASIYIEGITDTKSLHDSLLQPILNSNYFESTTSIQHVLQILKEKVIPLGTVRIVCNWEELFSSLTAGNSIIIFNGLQEALSVGTKGGEHRGIEESKNEPTYRGTRESFTELLSINIGLLRKRIKDPNLWVESMKIGERTQTDVTLMYIHGIANEEIISEVRMRLKRIKIDAILESGYIEQLIEDQTFTPFPTIYNTEKPDVVTANLLEGKIAILIDGTPFVLTVPVFFIEFFQAADDYYSRFDISSFIRFLRVFTFFISLVTPSLYIALTTFHQEMIPTNLLFTLAAQREGTPFPALIEALLMEFAFEILREAGVRLPKAVGGAVSIVGALVIGQAAVQAGIVSNIMVIVVSITAVASFSTPAYNIASGIRLIRFLLMIAASTLGFYGIMIGGIILMAHLCSLRSFGIPFMAPLAPFIFGNTGDTIIRTPLWMHKHRPKLISQTNKTRQGNNQNPTPPKSEKKSDQNDV